MGYDGNEWVSNSDSSNIGFVTGFVSGVVVAYNSLYNFRDSTDTNYTNNQAEKISLFKITIGQIKEGIDKFYGDFSNKKIKIVDAVYVVKMQIKGENPNLIDAQIRYLRMQPIDEDAFKKAWSRVYITIPAKSKNDKLTSVFADNKDIEKGKVSKEDFIISGFFITETSEPKPLFCYGSYK